MSFTPKDGGEKVVMEVYDFKGPGIALSMYNTDAVSPSSSLFFSFSFSPGAPSADDACDQQSIEGFAHSSFKMALSKKMPLVSGSA